jgi:hypothetical protein
MREQTIVWRNDVVEMFGGMEWCGSAYESDLCLVILETGEFLIGKFRAYGKDFYELFFMTQDGYDYKLSRVKEFTFLE